MPAVPTHRTKRTGPRVRRRPPPRRVDDSRRGLARAPGTLGAVPYRSRAAPRRAAPPRPTPRHVVPDREKTATTNGRATEETRRRAFAGAPFHFPPISYRRTRLRRSRSQAPPPMRLFRVARRRDAAIRKFHAPGKERGDRVSRKRYGRRIAAGDGRAKAGRDVDSGAPHRLSFLSPFVASRSGFEAASSSLSRAIGGGSLERRGRGGRESVLAARQPLRAPMARSIFGARASRSSRRTKPRRP